MLSKDSVPKTKDDALFEVARLFLAHVIAADSRQLFAHRYVGESASETTLYG